MTTETETKTTKAKQAPDFYIFENGADGAKGQQGHDPAEAAREMWELPSGFPVAAHIDERAESAQQ